MKIFNFTKLGWTQLVVMMVAVSVGTAAAQSGTFTDRRDGKTYKTVRIGGKTWMAQNMNYPTGNSWCYEDNNANCEKCGRLYDWNTARTACPSGWHLPSREEWVQLAKVAGGTGAYGGGGIAGKKLKSTYGWDENGNGTDEFGFSALPGGFRGPGGAVGNAGGGGYWWTATEYGDSHAYRRYMIQGGDDADEYHDGKSYGFSVRCISD